MLWKVCVLAVAAAAARVHVDEVFQKDRRLDKPISLPGEQRRLAEVVTVVRRQTGVQMGVQVDLANNPVTLAVDERPASAVLTDLGVLLHGFWIKRDGVYLLMTDEGSGRWAMRYRSQAVAREARQRLVGSLLPQQLAHLRSGGTISFSRLTPQQQSFFVTALVQLWLFKPDEHPATVRGGEHAELRYSPMENAVLLATLKRFADGTTAVVRFASVPL